MKHLFKFTSLLLAGSILFTSCKKDDTVVADEISQATLTQIANHGFETDQVRKVSNGYLVEGDIVLTPEFLAQNPSTGASLLRVANDEQYRTTNLVAVPRAITISVEGTLTGLAVWSAATDAFISRYNALNLQFNLQRVASGGDVKIVGFYEAPSGGFITLGSAGFPAGGNPYPEIRMNTHPQAYGTDPNPGYITSVLQHEMGHCIGFRHTDYFSRSSCGKRKQNEGTAGVGAIHIPGTPTGFDNESFMLACSAGTDRTFNSNDVIALNYLY